MNESSDAVPNEELNVQIQYRLINKLSESERRYRELVENLREVVFRCDSDGQLVFLNRAWTDLLGYSTAGSLGRSLSDFLSSEYPPYQRWLIDCQRNKLAVTAETLPFCHQSGTLVWLEISARLDRDAGYSGSLVDVTARRQAEIALTELNSTLEQRVQQRTHELQQANQQLQQSEAQLKSQAAELEQVLQTLQSTQLQLVQTEKMSGLGQLVAGVAHEINNPISFIHGNIEHASCYYRDLLDLIHLYQQTYPNPSSAIKDKIAALDLDFLEPDLKKLLQSLQTGSNRIAEIVKSLRSFSRLDESEFKEVDIHENLDVILMLLQNRFKANEQENSIEVIKTYSQLPLVYCSPGDLNQVFINILNNAVDALDEAHGQEHTHLSRCIWISTEQLSDNRISIQIRDNGCGIPASIQQQIFNPFFTTKTVGKGTGLGLSISYRIVENHGGQICVKSKPAWGTQFSIELPIRQGRL